MKTRTWLTRAGLALMLAFAVIAGAVAPEPAAAQSSFKFYVQVLDDLGNPLVASTTCSVYTTGTQTFPTIYSDPGLATARTNGWTISSAGECVWYSSATTAVDLIVVHKRGRVRYTGVTQAVNKVVLNRYVGNRAIAIPFSTNTSETSTGVTLPKGTVVKAVWLQDDSTVDTTLRAWIQVGILSTEVGGDLDGFCASGLATPGDTAAGGREIARSQKFVGCHAVFAAATNTHLGNLQFSHYISAIHAGALIAKGGVSLGTGTHAGFYWQHGYMSDGVAQTVAYKTSNHTVAGWIYLIVDEFGTDTAN